MRRVRVSIVLTLSLAAPTMESDVDLELIRGQWGLAKAHALAPYVLSIRKAEERESSVKGQEDAASKTSRKAITTIDQAALFFTRNWQMMKNLTLHKALTLSLTPNPAAHAGKRQLQEEDMRTRGGLENLRGSQVKCFPIHNHQVASTYEGPISARLCVPRRGGCTLYIYIYTRWFRHGHWFARRVFIHEVQGSNPYM